jgi:CBS domain containing-hemolysin-like protein
MLKFNYMKLALYLILVLIVSNAIVIDKALNILSLKELKRRARSGQDKQAASIYKMAAYDKSLLIILWIKGIAAGAVFIILTAQNSWWLALIFIAIGIWAVRVWQPATASGWVWGWSAMVAPAITWMMNYLHPLISLLGLTSLPPIQIRTGVHEKEDLLELLKQQSTQPENRISGSELRMAFNALTFGDKKVTDVMTPLRKLHVVAEDEVVGPLLMDELHKTGFSRFPVAKAGTVKSAQPQIVGTLFLKDLVGYTGRGSVAGLMHKRVYYINEVQSLHDALAAFIKTHHHLFIVVNNFEEIVGVLSIEDVLEQILGQKIVDEFDKYDDLRAVAGIEAKKEQQQHNHVKSAEPTSETA